MKETITKYLATITHGDYDRYTGSSFYIDEEDVEKTINKGLRVYIDNMGTDGGQKWYPCKVQKLQYELKSIEDCGETKQNKIETSYYHSDYDWKDHWC